MSELTFKRMGAAALMDEPGYDEVVDSYYAECANQAMGPANPDREMYRLYDNAGISHAVGVFDGKHLVGGLIVLVNTMAHFSRKGAVIESLFLLPEYRRTGAGLKLYNEAKRIAKDCGAPGVYVSAPTGSRLERMMRLKGVKQTNSVFFESV